MVRNEMKGNDADARTNASPSTPNPTPNATPPLVPASAATAGANTKTKTTLAATVIPQYECVGLQHEMVTQIICANLKACAMPDDEDDARAGAERRAPIDIMVALDVSGSMSGEPLALCKRTLELLLGVLEPTDRFGLVTFHNTAMVQCELGKLDQRHKESCLTTIRHLGPSGMTNISHAVHMACDELRRIDSPSDVQTVLLLTDGQPNKGISLQPELIEFTKSCLKGQAPTSTSDYIHMDQKVAPRRGVGFNFKGVFRSQRATRSTPEVVPSKQKDGKKYAKKHGDKHDIGLICFGYGESHNGELLQEMANTVHGSYYFVKDLKDVGAAFGDAIGGILSTVAKSTTLKIQLSAEAKEAGVDIVKVHYKEDAMEYNSENGSYFVDMGDFLAEESRDVLVEVIMATKHLSDDAKLGDASNSRVPHLVVSGTYYDTLAECNSPILPIFCYVDRPANSSAISMPPSPHVHVQWLRIKCLEAMNDIRANRSHTEDTLSVARANLNKLLEELDDGLTGEAGADAIIRQLRDDILDLMTQLKDPQRYRRGGAMFLSGKLQTHGMQRCMESNAATNNVYRNKKKAATSISMNLV